MKALRCRRVKSRDRHSASGIGDPELDLDQAGQSPSWQLFGGLEKHLHENVDHMRHQGAGSRGRAQDLCPHHASNPVLDESSQERKAVEAAGWEIGYDGMELRP